MRVPAPFSDPRHDGFVVALWDVDLPPDVLKGLWSRIEATGARHVAIPVFDCQSDIHSSDVGSCQVASYARVLDLARAGKDRGFSVGFLPIVVDRSWAWRGEFEPEERGKWFESYTRRIVALARDAQRIGASDLVVGSEFTKLYRYGEEWSRVLAAVRAEFSGPLVIAVNWSDLDIDFWEDADAIGVSAYHPLASSLSAPQEELDEGWRAFRDEILHIARAHDRPVHISEFGYASMTHAAQRPWDGDTRSPPDPELQARCFEAFRRAWHGVRELVRVDVWAAGDPREEDPRGFGVFGKPAEGVIRQMFTERAGI